MADTPPAPKVFISYSHTSPEHQEWVVRLAEQLMGHGVHVVADFWDLQHGQDLNSFMEQMVHDASITKVLAVCDERYMLKANARKGGVGTEALIISQRVYQDVGQAKFIPIAVSKDEQGRLHLPVFFESRYGFDFSDPDKYGEKYDELLRNLLNRPARKRPPLGSPPGDLMSDTPSPVKAAGRLVRLREAVDKNKPNVAVLVGDYLDCFAESLEDYRLPPSRGLAGEQLRTAVLESITSFLPARDNFLDFTTLLADHLHTNEESLVHLHGFLEKLMASTEWPPHLDSWNDKWADNFRFISRELFLSIMTVIAGRKRFELAGRLLAEKYHVSSRRREEIIAKSALSFDHLLECVDHPHHRRGQEGQQLPTTATLTRQRATHPRATFQALFQMDFLLYMYPFLVNQSRSFQHWHPRLLTQHHAMAPLDLFARAASPRGMVPFKGLFGIDSLGQLAARVSRFAGDEAVKQFIQSDYFWHLDLDKLLSYSAIDREVNKPK